MPPRRGKGHESVKSSQRRRKGALGKDREGKARFRVRNVGAERPEVTGVPQKQGQGGGTVGAAGCARRGPGGAGTCAWQRPARKPAEVTGDAPGNRAAGFLGARGPSPWGSEGRGQGRLAKPSEDKAGHTGKVQTGKSLGRLSGPRSRQWGGAVHGGSGAHGFRPDLWIQPHGQSRGRGAGSAPHAGRQSHLPGGCRRRPRPRGHTGAAAQAPGDSGASGAPAGDHPRAPGSAEGRPRGKDGSVTRPDVARGRGDGSLAPANDGPFFNPAKTVTKKTNAIRAAASGAAAAGLTAAAGAGAVSRGEQCTHIGRTHTGVCKAGRAGPEGPLTQPAGWMPWGRASHGGQGPDAVSAAPGGALTGARWGWAVLLAEGRAPRQGWVVRSQAQLSPVTWSRTPGWPGTAGSQGPWAAPALTPFDPLWAAPQPQGLCRPPSPGATGVLVPLAAKTLMSCPPSRGGDPGLAEAGNPYS